MAELSEKAGKTWVLALTSVASFMVALDALVVTTALSTIRLDLGASIEALEWTVNAYNLSFAVLLLTGAALGDRAGPAADVRRRPCVVRRGLGGVRVSGQYRRADRRPCCPGRRRGAGHAAGDGALERGVPARRTRQGAGNF